MSLADLYPFAIPMAMRFRNVTRRAGVLLRGTSGWGEFSPFPEYGPEVAARWLAAAREAADECWPPPRRHQVPVNATVPAVDAARAYDLAAASGCTTVKVKVAEADGTYAADIDRVEAVRDALGRDGKVRIDANGAWDVDTATRMLRELERFDLEYAEQPVATLDDMATLRRRVGVLLAADESVRTAADPLRIAGLEAADVVVLKVQPLGGVRAALEVAEACKLPVVVSSAVETSVGLAAGVALAAALPELPYACGLGTAALLSGDVVAEPLRPVEGHLAVRRPEPDADLLRRWEPTPAEADALLGRLASAEQASR